MNQFHFHDIRRFRTGLDESQWVSARTLGQTRVMSIALLVAVACGVIGLLAPPSQAAERLVIYSGRAERLIKPVLDAFQAKTGIQVALLSSATTELVNRLEVEGERTTADLFITNDAGNLERARALGLLLPLKMEELERVIPAPFRAPDNSWIGLSGRVWVIVYNLNQMKPADVTSILDLADPRWKGKIAIPNAGSEYLQAGVSVIKAAYGDERTQRFLLGLKANAGSHVYGKSSQIVEAVAKGEAAMGVVNHYYIYRHLAAQPGAPIAALMVDQQDGGMGAIMNAAGVGILKHTRHLDAAKRLVAFLVSPEGQRIFADLNKEYPLNPQVSPDPALPDRRSFRAANVPLTRLAELRESTMSLIETAGLR